jgi:hypothetical protein
MSIERKLEQIRASDLDNKTQIERYQTILEELLSRNLSGNLSDYQTVLSHCELLFLSSSSLIFECSS